MPYKIKCTGKNKCKVYGPNGPKSKKPLTKAKALAQMRALYAHEPKARKK